MAESTATVFAALATTPAPFPEPVAADRAASDDAADSAPPPEAPEAPEVPEVPEAGRVQVPPFLVPEAPGVTRGVTSPNSATGRPGVPLHITVTTSGDPVPSISFKGEPPTRIMLTDHGDGTATVTGTPKKEGVHRLVIRAKFGRGPDKYVVSQSFTLTVVDS